MPLSVPVRCSVNVYARRRARQAAAQRDAHARVARCAAGALMPPQQSTYVITAVRHALRVVFVSLKVGGRGRGRASAILLRHMSTGTFSTAAFVCFRVREVVNRRVAQTNTIMPYG